VADLLNLSIGEILFKYFVVLYCNFFICTNYSNTFPIFIIFVNCQYDNGRLQEVFIKHDPL